VLKRLNPTDRALLALAGVPLMTAVVDSGLPRAGGAGQVRLHVKDFVGSVALLAWAKGCAGFPWTEKTCAAVARGGNLEVLQWAMGHDCPTDAATCLAAARGGHLTLLQWMHEQYPPCLWKAGPEICPAAARGGHLEVLQWLREKGCPWEGRVCMCAAAKGHLDVLRWAREQDPPCPWWGAAG
jgi:hypothetical protein